VSEETDPPPIVTVADASTSRAPLGASRSLGTARAPNAGAGRAPAPGRRVRAINGRTGDTTITADISTLPAGDYLFLSADSAGVGVAGTNGASFAEPQAAASRMAPSARMSASRQLSPSARQASVGSPDPYGGTLPPPITESATLDGCAGSSTCSANLRVEGGTFVVTGLVHGALRVAEQRVAAGDGGSGPTLQVVCQPTAPVRADDVHCVVSMTDGSEFELKTLTSSLGAQALVQVNVNSTLTTYDWTGDAVVPTRVDASAIVAGKPATAFGRFDPIARTFPDADQPPRPVPFPTKGKPNLKTDYPGMRETKDGWQTLLGGVGFTWHLFPDYDAKQVTSGPNTGLWYVRNFRWVRSIPQGATDPVADGIYISVALFKGDPLYEMQDGKDGYCSKQDFDILRSEVYEHEVLHRVKEIALRQELKLHEEYETFVYAAPAGTPIKQILLDINESVQKYNERILSNDTAVDTPGLKSSLTCQPRGLK
jgi:hypothetical protein